MHIQDDPKIPIYSTIVEFMKLDQDFWITFMYTS
jgi:hypothetical protein